MDIKINCDKNISLDYVKLQKMAFLYNALEDGWTITKNENNYYVFIKNMKVKKKCIWIHIFIDL